MVLALFVVFALVRRLTRPVVATVVVIVVLLAITAGNIANAHLRVESAGRAEDAGAIEWGPMHPDAIAMFDAVERLTAATDVVAAPKARAMVLETKRPSIQVDDFRPIPPDVDVALVVVERNTRLAGTMAGDAQLRTGVGERSVRAVRAAGLARSSSPTEFAYDSSPARACDVRGRVVVDGLAVELDLGLGAARADLHAHAAFELEPQQVGLGVLLDARQRGARRSRSAASACSARTLAAASTGDIRIDASASRCRP